MSASSDPSDGQDPQLLTAAPIECEGCGTAKASASAPCVACETTGPMMTRRTAMRAAAIAGAAAFTGVSMTGSVAANSAIDYDLDISPKPWIKVDEVTLRRHYGDYDELDFERDDGVVANLSDEMGFVIPSEDPATRDEDDEEDKNAWNPFTLDAKNFDFSRNKDMPREAEDDDDDPIYWYQQEWWTGAASVSEASLRSLEIQGNAGDSATFDGDGELEVTGSLGNIRLHVVFDVDELDSTGEIHINVGDGTNSVTAKVDPDGDDSNEEVIATAAGGSYHAEPRLGDLEGNVDDLNEISEVEVEFVDAYGEIRIYGLDVERTGSIDWGTRQIKDEDDEFDTETVETPEGEFSITSLDTLPTMAADEYVRNIKAEGEIRASELPSDQVDVVFEDADRHGSGSMTERMRIIWSFHPDDEHFNVSWEDLDGLHDEVGFDSTNYLEAGFETGHDEEQTIEDFDDDDLNLTDVTSDYEGESLDDEFQVTGSVFDGEYTVLYLDIRMTENQADRLSDTAVTVGPPDREPSGILDRLFTIPGAVVGGLMSVLTLRWLNIRPFGGS